MNHIHEVPFSHLNPDKNCFFFLSIYKKYHTNILHFQKNPSKIDVRTNGRAARRPDERTVSRISLDQWLPKDDVFMCIMWICKYLLAFQHRDTN